MPIDVSGFVAPPINTQGINQIANTLQEQRFNDQRMAYRKQQDEEESYWKKLGLVEGAEKSVASVMTQNEKANEFLKKRTGELREEILSDKKLMNLPPTELYGAIKQRFQPLLETGQSFKDRLVREGKLVEMMAAENKNLNKSRLLDDVGDKVFNKYFQDVNGKYVPIARDVINENESVASQIASSPDFWKYAADTNMLIDAIKGEKGDARSYFYRDPKTGVVSTFQGNIPFWADESETPDLGKFVKSMPKFNIKSVSNNTIRDKDGNLVDMKIVPPDVMQQVLNTQEKKIAFEKLYNEEKINKGIRGLDDVDDEALKGNFMYRLLQNVDKNQPRETQRDFPPVRSSSGGGSGGGSTKNAAADWVRRATAAISTTDVQKIKDEFSQLYQGDKNLYEDVDFTGDKITVKFKPGKQSDLSMIAGLLSGKGVDEGGVQTVELDAKDPYLSQKLARVYQQIMGGDVNVERTQYPTKTPTVTDKPTGSWKDRAKKVN